ncbi:MAG: arylsulfatase [Planctomycetota bacterium]|nr:arylsulfatase [Planctomycetota bacterium]
MNRCFFDRLYFFAFLVTFGIVVSGSALGSKDSKREQVSKPNILLIITDDQGYAPVGRHGHPWLKTPNLDSLYDRSIRMDRFLVSPTCAPTRSAIMTGRYPMRNGITHTILERERLTLNATTLPQTLKKAGYTSGIFGKWHLGDEPEYLPSARGFDESFIHGAGGIGQKYDGSCADAPNNTYFDPYILRNGSFVKTHGFCTDVFFETATQWMISKSKEKQPFFCYLATNAPHSPYIAPPENKKRFTDMGFDDGHAGFYGMIENIDANVGTLMHSMESKGLLESTVVIFMSDNGMAGFPGNAKSALGTAPDGTQRTTFNADMKGLKGSVDEGGVRVPFFISWKGKLVEGKSLTQIASQIDIFPTLAEIAGAELPEKQVEGRSFLSLLRDDQSPWPDRYLFDHAGRWPLNAEPNDFQWKQYSVRNDRFRFVEDKFLYDMQSDPGQTKNCIADHPEVVAEMRAAYDSWWKETRPMMVNEMRPLSPSRPFHDWFHKQQSESGIPDWPLVKGN